MRINTPPASIPTSIAVSGLASPTTFTTGAAATIANGATVDIAPITSQREIIISNRSTADTIFARDTVATTQSVGTPINPLATVFLTLNATVRLTNASGNTVTYTFNQTGP